MSTKSYQQMIAKANADLLVLSKQHEQTQARFLSIQAELQTLEAASNARRLRVSTMQETVTQLRTNFETQRAHAELAEGTLVTLAASAHLAAQDRHLKAQNKALAALVDTCDKEQERDQAQRLRLEAEAEQCNARLADIRSKRIALDKAKEQAHKELGEAEYRDIVAQIELAQAAIKAKAKELGDAQQLLRDIAEEATDRLAQWPEHRREVRLMVPVEDEATHVLEAAIALYDALLKEGSRVAIDTDTFRRVHPFVSSLAHMLWLEERDVYPALNGRASEARKLTERISDMKKLRSLHQDSQREKEG